MSQGRLGSYYRVDRGGQKRSKKEAAIFPTTVSPDAKRPAHSRFAHLAVGSTNCVKEPVAVELFQDRANTCEKHIPLRPSKVLKFFLTQWLSFQTHAKGGKSSGKPAESILKWVKSTPKGSSLNTTDTEVKSNTHSAILHVATSTIPAETPKGTRKPVKISRPLKRVGSAVESLQKNTVRRQTASTKTQVVEIQNDLKAYQKCQTSASTTRTAKVRQKTAQQQNFTMTSSPAEEQAPSTKQLPPSPVLSPTKPSVLRAHQRFAYLSEPVSSVTTSNAVQPTSTTSIRTDAEPELTQTQSAITFDLPLPHDFRVLLELFRSCDTVVSMLHNRSEICGFDKLKPAVQEVVRRNFEETHVGQFLTVYPMVYLLRFEKHLDKFTRRPTGNYVLVLSPNLRTDGTQIGHDSPSKGHLVFTGTRLIQRRNRFHRLLLGHVFRAHREFLHTKLGIDSTGLPNDTELRRWHPKFCLESMVPPIKPTPLPIRPSAMEGKITSAKDAVKAFQARALFREADICQSVALLRHDPMPTIPSPTKASACSPRKPTVQSGPSPAGTPSVALFTSSAANVPPQSPSVACSLKGVSETLLAKVRARENERRLLTQLTQNAIPESRRAIYSRLPSMITQVWTVMRAANGRPIPMTTIASRVADAHHSGLSADVVANHLNVLQEFCSTWLEKLDWASPHLRLKNPDLPVGEVIASVRERLAAEGFNL
ncbi:hypothetical protein EG68_05838 [Paragonimus skrjabini miyazakii]|uniref:CDT1 Geminin-binding domain-containing protein n=1 Tax=Paragonimus skrjabini miyazakii TaxID=59628 RepID=A0A8S9YQL9_9TREM|nr:hypothetical protein EG68_05838 [Paragonimus skrjabini miyazakii]